MRPLPALPFPMRMLWATLALAVHVGASASASASTSGNTLVRAQEIAQCLPQEMVTWADGRDRPAGVTSLRFALRHDDAPPWFSAAQVLGLVDRAAQAWSECGLAIKVELLAPGAAVPEAAIEVLWSDARSVGSFGQAHLRSRVLALGPAAFHLLKARNPTHPALDTLQMVLSHEMGHFFGLLAHSRRCVDVMSYYDNSRGERCFTRDGQAPVGRNDYRALLPTSCDIARCRALNQGTLVSAAP